MTHEKASPSPIAPLPEQLEAFCQKYYIRKLALFGSVLREDFTNESDVDVLVEFEDGHTPDFFDFYTIEQELSGLSGGHAVDLVTQKALNRHLRDEIVRTVEVRFEQG